MIKFFINYIKAGANLSKRIVTNIRSLGFRGTCKALSLHTKYVTMATAKAVIGLFGFNVDILIDICTAPHKNIFLLFYCGSIGLLFGFGFTTLPVILLVGSETVLLTFNLIDAFTDEYKSSIELGIEGLKRDTLTNYRLAGNNVSQKKISEFANCLKNNKSLVSLTLFQVPINDENIKELADSLKINRSLQRLELDGNDMNGDLAAKHFSEVLSSNRTIQCYIFKGIKISVLGIQDLSEALKNNRTLKTLNLNNNFFGNEGVQYLCKSLETNQALQQLILSGNNLDDLALQCISNVLRIKNSLQKIDLSHNTFGYDEFKIFSEALSQNSTLQELNLGSAGLTGASISSLAVALKINNTMKKLTLSCNHLEDEAVKDLANFLKINRSLRHLDLSFSPLTSEQYASLNLNLRMRSMSDTGVKYLSDALKINQTLQTLILSYNRFENKGFKHIAETLQVNESLHKLTLLGIEISKQGLDNLMLSLKSNFTICSLEIATTASQLIQDAKVIQLLIRNKEFQKNGFKIQFLMGLHTRLGDKSSIGKALNKNPLLDKNLLNEVFSFVNESKVEKEEEFLAKPFEDIEEESKPSLFADLLESKNERHASDSQNRNMLSQFHLEGKTNENQTNDNLSFTRRGGYTTERKRVLSKP